MDFLEIKILDEDGREKPLKNMVMGKWTVLYFYPKDNTSGCTIEAKEFTELIDEFGKHDVQVIGVSRDSQKRHRNFREKHDLRIRLLTDSNAELHRALGAWGKKKLYGKEYEGVIRSTFILDPEGKIAWKEIGVRARGHAKKVLEEVIKVV